MIDIVVVQDLLIDVIKEIVPNTSVWLGSVDDLLSDAQKSLPACRVAYTGSRYEHKEGNYALLSKAEVSFNVFIAVKNLRSKLDISSDAHKILEGIRTMLNGKRIKVDGVITLRLQKEELIHQQSAISVFVQTYTYKDRLVGVDK